MTKTEKKKKILSTVYNYFVWILQTGAQPITKQKIVEKSPSIKVHRVTDPLKKNLSLTLVRLLVKWSL